MEYFGSKDRQSLREFVPVRQQWSAGGQAARVMSLLLCLLGVTPILGCGDVDLGELLGIGRSLPETPSLRITPARALVLGSTQVTIEGGVDVPSFGPDTEVLFGELPTTDVEVVDAKTIRVTAPAQPAGQVDVVVRVTDGTTVTSPSGFEYVAVKDADAEILGQIERMFPGPPRLVSAVATNNISLRVMFSEPVREGATDASNYFIVTTDGGVLLLDTSKVPAQSEDCTVVDLTTRSQGDALYHLTVTGIRDLAGNPMASPDMLVNPTETTFTGIAPAMLDEHIDSDGDDFADWFEMLGWQVTLELADGTRTQFHVTSDPFNPDTDGDGVLDGEENARSMDPRTDDTDADLVLDADEIWGWRSNPCDQDSDDDGFSDMTEVLFGTSLILADTDGDQLDDRDEMLNRNRNPHIADLPIVSITVGEMNLELDERYSYTDQFGEEQQVQETFSDTLQRDTSSSLSDTHSEVGRGHIEGRFTVKGGKDATGPYGGFEAEVSGGFAYEKSHAWGTQSSVSTARTYNEAISRVAQFSSTSGVTRETVGARLSATVTIGAASDIAFQITDIEISVLQQDPRDRSRLTPVATLVPADPDSVYSVGPLVPEIGPLIFQSTDVFPSMVEELMKDPRGLILKVANFDITDEFERNFAFTSQEVVERTASVTIDYGNGESETSRIATAGRFDPQGQPTGISMADALRAMNLLPFEGDDPELGNVDDATDTRPKRTDPDIEASFGMRTISITGDDGEPAYVRTITRVRGVQDDFDLATVEPDKLNDGGFWVVFVSISGVRGPGSDAPSLRGTTNFDEARLHAGEAYILAYVKDKDRDELTSLEEFFSGSSDTLSDTDRDDLGDFFEVRGQWNHDGLGAWLVYTDRLPGGYRAYSAPYLKDSDEDGLPDDMEYALCRYEYECVEDGEEGGELDCAPPTTAFAIGVYSDHLTDPSDNRVAWEHGLRPDALPDAFPCDGLPDEWLTEVDPETGEPIHQWHTEIDPDTGAPVHFPGNRASLDPRKIDTDEDGINDGDEVNGYYVDLFDDNPVDMTRTRVFVRTDPLSTDTDWDGLVDGMERQFGTNPASPDSGTVFDDDLDGLPNRVEETGWDVCINGVELRVYSNPDDPDSDNDNLPDYVEWVLGTNPWHDEYQTVDPDLAAPGYDSDGDGLSDYEEWDGVVPPQDRDKLAFCDLVPNCAGYEPSDMAHATDPVDADTDDDDISDGDELAGWTVHLCRAVAGYPVFSDPLEPDTDFDGWNDGTEWRGIDGLLPTDPDDARDATDPYMQDTDEDGTNDGLESSRVATSYSWYAPPDLLNGIGFPSDQPPDGEPRYERFQDMAEPICSIEWWGLNRTGDNRECTENPMPFEVTFRAGSYEPGDVIRSYAVEATGTVVARMGGAAVYRYELILDDCLDLPDGWVSIVGGGDPSCLFQWCSSGFGDFRFCEWGGGGGGGGGGGSLWDCPLGDDLSMRLWGPPGESRDPVTPDQRVTVVFDSLSVIKDGNPGGGCSIFTQSAVLEFDFGVWWLEDPSPDTWINSDHFFLSNQCDSSECENECSMGHSSEHVRINDATTVTVSQHVPPAKSFIVPFDASVMLHGEVVFWYISGEISVYEWSSFGDQTPYTVPIDPKLQLFRVTTGPVQNILGYDVEVEVEGRIGVD